ncbi:hypothetical protein [Clostridium chromiireducens]|uniref:hypothetical protein n=1 Tax=Clostridium chromiireducens TaxID=225345 RepID=UPI0015FAF876|nr:hypothetical protein [Clostridium chromiireducens]
MLKDEIKKLLQCIRLIILNKASKNQYIESEFEVDVSVKGFKLIFKSKKNDFPIDR